MNCTSKCKTGQRLYSEQQNAINNGLTYKYRRVSKQIEDICAYCNFNMDIIENMKGVRK